MSDSILPKVFEGFPELANQAESLDAALDALAARVDAKLAVPAPIDNSADITALKAQVSAFESEHQALREQISSLEAQRAELRDAAKVADAPGSTSEDDDLREEVAHWKSKYEDLAGRYDTQIAAVAAPSADTAALEEKDSLIETLTQAKETAGGEIARLAEALAIARSDANGATQQLEEAKAQLAKSEGDADTADVAALESEIASLKSDAETTRDTISGLEGALKAAEETAAVSQAAQAKASTRLSALIETLNTAAKSTGAA